MWILTITYFALGIVFAGFELHELKTATGLEMIEWTIFWPLHLLMIIGWMIGAKHDSSKTNKNK